MLSMLSLGNVVNISSTSSFTPFQGILSYNMSKVTEFENTYLAFKFQNFHNQILRSFYKLKKSCFGPLYKNYGYKFDVWRRQGQFCESGHSANWYSLFQRVSRLGLELQVTSNSGTMMPKSKNTTKKWTSLNLLEDSSNLNKLQKLFSWSLLKICQVWLVRLSLSMEADRNILFELTNKDDRL